MDLLIATNTVAQEQADKAPASGTPGWATDGNPATGQLATDAPAWHYNMMMSELIAVIKAAGITPSNADWSQVLKAMQTIFSPAQYGVAPFSASLAQLIGGYPLGAIAFDAVGNYWRSTKDENLTVPGAENANWVIFSGGFTPVQQGGGPNQTAGKICIGEDSTGIGGIRYALMNGSALTDQGFILRSYAPNPAVGDTAFTNIYYAGGVGHVWAAISDSIYGSLAWYSDVTNLGKTVATMVSGVPQVSTDAQGIKLVQAAGSTSPDGTSRPQFYYNGGNVFLATEVDVATLSSRLTSEITTRSDQVSDLNTQVGNRIVGLAGSGFITVQSLVVDQTSQNLTLNLGNGVVAQGYAQVQTGVINQDPIFGWWEKTRLPTGAWLLKQYITCASWAGNAAVKFPIAYASPPQINITTSDDNGSSGLHKSTYANYVRGSLTAVGLTLDVWFRDTSGNFQQSATFDGNITAVGVVNS
ncbi:bacteriophage tail fiber protein [Acetobacter orientalis]|uniref:Bacteriophage tail fiber protein n=1 Tax=Acetobacter orientalis TaxID=146474 RepID=A0A2Z5ZE19_9PROT|nr:bacteriophage tail fiber protein [Acetobacter orientalis]